MKKIFVPLVALAFVIACSPKGTPGKSMPSSNNSAPVIVDKPIANNNPSTNGSTTATTTTSATVTASSPSKTAAERSGPGNDAAAVEGMSIYNQKCNRCHGLKVTSDYTWPQWASIMQVMAPKANLSETEKQKVLAYVHANAKP